MVINDPEGLKLRDITSHEATCDAYGFGYRKKNARETMDQGSLDEILSSSGRMRDRCRPNSLIQEGLGEELH